jgi:glycine dehydrogenase
MTNLNITEKFVNRHIGPDEKDVNEMLKAMGIDSLDKLIDETVPAKIRLKEKLGLDESLSEYRLIQYLGYLAKKNKIQKSYIGLGYYGTITPGVILRNILENPEWYTQYTPYQAEISQGRLEALINYQTMIIDLTGLPIANASLLMQLEKVIRKMQINFLYPKNVSRRLLMLFCPDLNRRELKL